MCLFLWQMKLSDWWLWPDIPHPRFPPTALSSLHCLDQALGKEAQWGGKGSSEGNGAGWERKSILYAPVDSSLKDAILKSLSSKMIHPTSDLLLRKTPLLPKLNEMMSLKVIVESLLHFEETLKSREIHLGNHDFGIEIKLVPLGSTSIKLGTPALWASLTPSSGALSEKNPPQSTHPFL